MTIPEDVREAMRQALEFCAGDYCMTGDRYEHFDAALAWLDAQPEAPEVMTIPEDVRNWIASAAQVASDSARYYDVDPSTSDAVLAWLEAQPAAPAPDWTTAPGDGEMNKVKAQKILLRIAQIVQELRKKPESEPADAPYSVENIIEILNWLEAQPEAPERWEPVEDAEITLPDDLRICRRVEVTE